MKRNEEELIKNAEALVYSPAKKFMYRLTFPVSNAINPYYMVWADSVEEALGLIADYFEKEDIRLFLQRESQQKDVLLQGITAIS